ncbi:restriction endonuclease subunit S [Dickeya dadantii]|uniref:restriction endonuclease subunit S n=1 Tax=Dickeya dadantii TaxID=204038 RepID=UPI0021DAF983|nr:restriction endonuclease subunit S [Dickeya dadantii]
MDAKQFLAEFGYIAHAPEGIARLRELVFSLASDGKLIPDCEPIEKTHLDKVADFVMGQAPPGNECNTTGNGTIFVKTGEFGELYPIVREWTTKPLKFAKQGDVLICVVGATVGKLNLAIDCAIGRSVAAIRPRDGLKTKYLYFMLMSFTLRLRSGSRGSAQGVIGKSELSSVKLRVPSDNEQYRIVAKVDELMALCDKLEAQQQARRKLQNALRHSTLQAVASASSPHELQTAWARLVDNFGQLFHASEDVAAFKGLILDLAVSGTLLTTETRHASTGADLIDAIAYARIEWSKVAIDQEKKEALAALKKLRIQQLITPEEQLPKHWTWASLLEVSKVIIDCDHKTPTYTDSGVHLIRTTDIRNGEMRFDATKKVSWESYLARSRRLTPQVGDIFFTREAPMGEAAIVPNGHVVCLGQRLMLIRLFPELFNNKFLVYVIQSPSFQKRLRVAAIGMTVKHINVVDVENLVVPVPPKAEQDRIVAIVDGLFRMCDYYAEQLSRKQRIATNLAASAVVSLTGITIEQEEEPMKAPETELIAPLRLGIAPDIKAQAPLATILARHHGEMSAKDLWQRFGGEIDAFYAQLKTEVAHGWIKEPAPAEVREKPANTVSA